MSLTPRNIEAETQSSMRARSAIPCLILVESIPAPILYRIDPMLDDYETIYQQALTEMQLPDFVATWRLLTAWGNKPE